MELSIVLNESSPKYIQIYEQIKKAIITKKINTHEQLPSKRDLSFQTGVSIHTVQEAYEQLVAEGFIYSKIRSGYFVSPFEYEWNEIDPIKKPHSPVQKYKIDIDFNNGHIDTRVFPYNIWRKLMRVHLNGDNLYNGKWQGELILRDQIARYVKRSRGVQCDASQVYIYSGTQSQLKALCLFFRKIKVGMEEPGFNRARSIFTQCHLDIKSLNVDESGITIPSSNIQLLYTTPAHQFPLGMVMTLKRRADLLNWATESDAYIIEDDYDSEFRYKGAPFPSLAQMDQLQRVIYFGTFSKTLLPSMRISYMILPNVLINKFNDFYREEKTTVSLIDQQILADFLSEGLFDKHLARMRTLYRKKQRVLIENIKKNLSDEFELIGEQSGLHIVLKLPQRISEKDAIDLAASVGVGIYPISPSYQVQPKESMVILGYGGLTLEQIEEGITRLANVWEG